MSQETSRLEDPSNPSFGLPKEYKKAGVRRKGQTLDGWNFEDLGPCGVEHFWHPPYETGQANRNYGSQPWAPHAQMDVHNWHVRMHYSTIIKLR